MNYTAESSRKRKLITVSHDSIPEYPRGVYDMVGRGYQFYQSVHSDEAGRNQCHPFSTSLGTLQHVNRNFHKFVVEKINGSQLEVLPQPFSRGRWLASYRTSCNESLNFLNPHLRPSNAVSRAETHVTHPLLQSFSVLVEKGRVGTSVSEHDDHAFSDGFFPRSSNMTLESSVPSQSFHQKDVICGGPAELVCEMHGPRDLGSVVSNNASHVVGILSGTCEPACAARSDENKTNGVGVQTVKELVAEMISPGSDDDAAASIDKDGCRIDNDHKNDKHDVLLESPSEISKLGAGSLAPVVAAELWAGFLQLNSSTTLSATAFFKSGEKMPAAKWPKIMEVKGKVRLIAFEKYIQDLPRSRTRGLMVISLCCTEGSSKSEQASTKEAARGYKKGERVGFAQLSQGADLYVCPRSHAIITILAKHGFFKGTTIHDNHQELLIGCVVWRRNHPSSSPTVKTLESKMASSIDEPRNSPDASQRTGEAVDESLFSASGNTDINSMNILMSRPHSDLQSSSSADGLLLASSLSMTQRSQISSSSDSSSLPAAARPQQVETTLLASRKTIEAASRVHLVVLPSSSGDAGRKPMTADDYDDLPDFDFGTASDAPLSSRGSMLNAVALKEYSAGQFHNSDCSWVESSTPFKPMATPTLSVPYNFGFERFPLLLSAQAIPMHKQASECKVYALPNSKEKQALLSRMPQKKLFDNDDDMPDWCPPDMDPLSPSALKPTRPPGTHIPGSLAASISSAPSDCMPLPSLPGHQQWDPQPVSHTFPLPVNFTVMHDPTKPNEHPLRTNMHLQPWLDQFDAKIQVHPPGWRARTA